MQRFRARLRATMPAGLLVAALALPVAASAAGTALQASGIEGSQPQSAARERPEAARPGAYCLPGGCGPRAASLWNGAAFGVALIAIGWQARRRPTSP
jgi:hypothetical protein